MRLLVACHELVLSGGLLRFERLGQALRSMGHELAFLTLGANPVNSFASEHEVLNWESASSCNWDATLVPGAGFPRETMEQFNLLRQPRFGIRVQMVLNDQSRRERFLLVNRSLAPEIVVFNSDQWPVGSFRDFSGARFHQLIGAVDTSLFHPAPRPSRKEITIGAQLSKNPWPLIEAMRLLPDHYRILFFGYDRAGVLERAQHLKSSGRLVSLGPVLGRDLQQFYRDVDIVVSTEQNAGWANIVAEAMASGAPVVCTRHGTTAIARHLETAFVLEEPTPEALMRAMLWIGEDHARAQQIAQTARHEVSAFDWGTYARKFLALLSNNRGETHYIAAPELHLYGKTDRAERVAGLEMLLGQCAGWKIFDAGAAEGIVAGAFLERGAESVQGVELEPSRVAAAMRLFGGQGLYVRVADLNDTSTLAELTSSSPDGFDLCLYLGVHQHLAPERRMSVLMTLAKCAKRFLAVRAPEAVLQADRIEEALERAFFKCVSVTPAQGFAGPLRLYERAS